MHEEVFQGVGGLELLARTWRPSGPVRAVIIAVHGYKAHGGVFAWAGEQFASRGIATYALDLRGHGKSQGERLYVDKYVDYVGDVGRLVDLARAREPGVPIFVLGHSAGGVIASGYVLDNQEQLSGFICESFAFEAAAPSFVVGLIRGLSHIAPRAGVLDPKDDDFSRDPVFVDRMKHDPLIIRTRYPAQSVAELARANERLAREFPRMTLPVLILHGTSDKVTRPRGSQRFFDTVGSSDKTLRLYAGHFHDLLNDVGKELVAAEITAWIEERVPVPMPARPQLVPEIQEKR